MATITELCGCAWQDAIMNVAEIIGKDPKDALRENWSEIEAIANKLHVNFDFNGNII